MDKQRDLALAIGNILYEKGAKDIQILRVDHLTTIADYFVIASGRNVQAVRALAEDVEDKLTEKGIEEQGSHRELLAAGGIYAKLYAMYSGEE